MKHDSHDLKEFPFPVGPGGTGTLREAYEIRGTYGDQVLLGNALLLSTQYDLVFKALDAMSTYSHSAPQDSPRAPYNYELYVTKPCRGLELPCLTLVTRGHTYRIRFSENILRPTRKEKHIFVESEKDLDGIVEPIISSLISATRRNVFLDKFVKF